METPKKCVNDVILASLIVNIEQILHIVMAFPFVDFEQVHAGCVTVTV